MISIIIPNYNRTQKLIRAIDSVLIQTYQDFEIIVVDDASKVDVKKYLDDKYKDLKKSKIQFIENGENKGSAACRNQGVSLSKGKYVAFLDSDDYWLRKKLARQITEFEKNKNIELVYCDQYILLRDGKSLPSGKEIISFDLWKYLIQGWTAPNTSTLIFKKNAFEKLNGFDENLSSCQDHDLWMRIANNSIILKGIKESLSVFTFDADNRISLNIKTRMLGVKQFLAKWKSEIIQKENKTTYKKFKKEYLFKTSFPMFKNAIFRFNFFLAILIYFKYLYLNRLFYKEFLKIL